MRSLIYNAIFPVARRLVDIRIIRVIWNIYFSYKEYFFTKRNTRNVAIVRLCNNITSKIFTSGKLDRRNTLNALWFIFRWVYTYCTIYNFFYTRCSSYFYFIMWKIRSLVDIIYICACRYSTFCYRIILTEF